MPKGKVHSIRAERAVKLLASGEAKTKKEAFLKAGYSEKMAKEQRSITSTQSWKDLVKRYLSDDDLARVHSESLAATSVITATSHGEITDIREIPDHKTRLKAVELGYRLHGRLTDQTGNTTNIQINQFDKDQSEAITKAINESLDKML